MYVNMSMYIYFHVIFILLKFIVFKSFCVIFMIPSYPIFWNFQGDNRRLTTGLANLCSLASKYPGQRQPHLRTHGSPKIVTRVAHMKNP